MDDQTKNLVLATALSFLVILIWTMLFPPQPPAPEEIVAGQPSVETIEPSSTDTAAVENVGAQEVTQVESPRISFDNGRINGSLALRGGRIDDLTLNEYEIELDGGENVHLLTPQGNVSPYFAFGGWQRTSALNLDAVPNEQTDWQVEGNASLSPGSPLTLVWRNAQGATYRQQISLDENYMFTIVHSVENQSGVSLRLAPYHSIIRQNLPDTPKFWVSHEGAVVNSGDKLSEVDYDDFEDFEMDPREGALAERYEVSQTGWTAFADRYWLTALAPKPGTAFSVVTKYNPDFHRLQNDVRYQLVDIPDGQRAEFTTYFFAGAKEVQKIREYETGLGLDRFVDTVDWGWFYFFTKPLYSLLHWLYLQIGNMGFAIIGLTFVIKLALFPLAYKSHVSMAKMKSLQPDIERIKERVGDDRQKLQQEMMALYKEKKVNPASGCLPILVQIPIFFSLYKVIFVTLDLRHAPFIGWIKDLSAADPTSFLNLFGALPFEIPAFLSLVSIGVWPILMGVTMWLQQKLNPAPSDPTQAAIFAWMPWIFMFMLGSFASGLVIYWVANNTLTFIQQYAIMRSQGVKPDLLGNILSNFKKDTGGRNA